MERAWISPLPSPDSFDQSLSLVYVSLCLPSVVQPLTRSTCSHDRRRGDVGRLAGINPWSSPLRALQQCGFVPTSRDGCLCAESCAESRKVHLCRKAVGLPRA